MNKFLTTMGMVLILTISVWAKVEKTYGDIQISSKDIVSVYDGDTFTINIPNYPEIIGNHISVRIDGIDTPEMKSHSVELKKKANEAKQFTSKSLKSAKIIILHNVKRDKYFRIDADVLVDGVSLTQLLIENKLGYSYDGGTKDKENEQAKELAI